jgi:hypothetical protein
MASKNSHRMLMAVARNRSEQEEAGTVREDYGGVVGETVDLEGREYSVYLYREYSVYLYREYSAV